MNSVAPDPASLPLLDLGRLDAGARDRTAFLCELRSLAREIGFFYLAGHGVAAEENAKVLAIARRFFALPEESKRAVAMVNSPHFRGYTEAGGEITRGARDWREQFDINSEREAVWRPGAPAWMRLQGPNQWPESLPELRPALLAWQSALTKVAVRLLGAFAEALGQNPDAFEPVYKGAPNQHIKIIRYPGRISADPSQQRDRIAGDPSQQRDRIAGDPSQQRDRNVTVSEQGVGPHKDSGLLTFVLQDSQDGLEVEAQDGRWIKAQPRDNTFVVNIGELLELASNGYLRATVHRVVAPPPGAERLSAAFFLGARHDSTTPLLALPPALAAEARGPASDPDNPLFRHVGTNYLKGRLRSHPDVAKRHYADLTDAPDQREGMFRKS
ncbi:2-oxoglutarate and iron-dependent oxygenase domain-containing protein [Methylocapsa polymorpha]|uniref:2-oxoglutarate-dependent ethylene/succinate-forming enzyme n=1 Tax=Methylocapsa polymorpha TaxID=3080828 RepID=A0ABZ0HWU2_9HYPH|nr:2-oxoglutarate and iron-dependent oxygenase domain-containing protein [Methylocapsa sp. RX1]